MSLHDMEAYRSIALSTVRVLKNSGKPFIKNNKNVFGFVYAALVPYTESEFVGANRYFESSSESREIMKEIKKDIPFINQLNLPTLFIKDIVKGQTLFERLYANSKWDDFWSWLDTVGVGVNENKYRLDTNLVTIKNLLDLNDVETELLKFQVLSSAPQWYLIYSQLFSWAFSRGENTDRNIIQDILGDNYLGERLRPNSNLFVSGLVRFIPNTKIPKPTYQGIVKLLAEKAGPVDFLSELLERSTKKSVSGSTANFSDKDKEIVTSLIHKTNENGINILVYGSRSLDKLGSILEFLSDFDLKISVLKTVGISEDELATRTYLAQRILYDQGIDSILVIPSATEVLYSKKGTSWLGSFLNSQDSTEEDLFKEFTIDVSLLTNNVNPTIWIADNPSLISEENVGRFLFITELSTASRAQRRAQIENVLNEIDVSDSTKSHISKYNWINVHQVKSALKMSNIVSHVEDSEFEDTIRRGIHNSQRALGRDAMEELRESVTKYSLEYLNLNSKYPIEKIIASLKKKQRGTLCFYGLPGAGKTLLAEYIATALDKPIIMKKASELLSKWVGENEKNIAGMFEEAKEAGAVLFLDESDSFLRDRTKAKAEWNVTQVNEILVNIEQFQGVFMAATNLFSEIDQAALRRFTFKIKFDSLNDDQRLKMLINEAGITETNEEYLNDIKEKLSKIKNLAPGDFATVKRQMDILDEILSVEDWLFQLQEECEIKMMGIESNKIGFGK